MAGLYEIIGELRREHPTPSATRTLDLVVAELGRTQDNLQEALARLDGRPLPSGGRPVLDELSLRARQAGVDQLRQPAGAGAPGPALEPIDEGQVGIAILLGVSALVVAGLALVAAFLGLRSLLHLG